MDPETFAGIQGNIEASQWQPIGTNPLSVTKSVKAAQNSFWFAALKIEFEALEFTSSSSAKVTVTTFADSLPSGLSGTLALKKLYVIETSGIATFQPRLTFYFTDEELSLAGISDAQTLICSHFWEMGWSDLRRYEIIDSVFVTVWNYDYRPELHRMAGLDWDGEHLWASYNAGGFFKFDSSATAVDIFGYERELKVTEFRSGPSNSPWNFAFADTFLWIAELNNPYLLKCAKDSTFSLIEQYALPGPRPTGVVWDGEHIWTCDDFTGKVDKHLELFTESYDPEDEVLPEGAVATQVDGSISTDTQWTLEESPYLATSEITVEPGAKLTIEPGVKVFFSESGGMEIQGVLRAKGTADSLIIFSHQQATKSWGSLKFSNSDTAPELQSTLSYAKVQCCLEITLNQSSPEMSHNLFRYMTGIGGRPVPETHLVIKDNLFYFAANGIRVGHGKYEENTSIVIDSNQFVYSRVVTNSDFIQRQDFEIVNNTFDNSHVGILNSEGVKVKNNAFHNCITGVGMNFARNIEIQGNTFDGPSITAIDIAYLSFNVMITDNTITDCQRQGILIYYNSEAELHNNNIYDNDIAVSIWQSAASVDATYNWWGTTNTDSIDALIEDYKDDNRQGKVHYLPILGAQVGSPLSRLSQTPLTFELAQNYPNPFNPTTTISYSLPQSAEVNISIFNITGQLVETLVNGRKTAGFHSVIWNASGISSGLYFYKIVINGQWSAVKKAIYMQ